MTKNQKLMENPKIKLIYRYLEIGRVCPMEACKAIIDFYYQGDLTYDERNAAVKLLAKVKLPA